MHTQKVNTAAPESAEQCKKPLSMSQLLDLFCYIMACSQGQKQPAFFMPPQGGDLSVAVSEDGSQTIIVWTLDGWPLAASVPEANYLAVLSGIPE